MTIEDPERDRVALERALHGEDLLLTILTDEIALRDNAAADNRAAEAGLDPSMRVTILGPVGVGKTFIASALGHIACRHGYNARRTKLSPLARCSLTPAAMEMGLRNGLNEKRKRKR